MNLKKNNVSYITWVILLFFTGASCAFLGLVLGQMFQINLILAAGGLVTLFFALVFGIYLLIGYFLEHGLENRRRLSMFHLSKRMELILFVAILAMGLVVRILMLEHAGEEAAFFEVCKVSGEGKLAIQSIQGSVYFYCLLLHGLFRIVGNHWIAGIWLQIILQIAGTTIITLALKKVQNKIPAYLVLIYMTFSPEGITAGITYSPQILYFCAFSIAFYVIADYLQRSIMMEKPDKFMWFYTILAGAMIGICSYLDISGFVLLLLWFVLPMVKRREYTTAWFKCVPLGILVCILIIGICIFIDAMMSNTTFGNILGTWSIIYGKSGLNYDLLVSRLSFDFVLLIALSSVGCFSFWRRVNTERFTPFILMAVVMGVFVFSGVTTENMNGSYILYVLLAILASVSITELFCREDLVRIRPERNEEKKEVDIQNTTKVEYIENPLPVPKKHVRKTMDYAFIPDESQMKYDIPVSDKDDYDLKIN